MSRSAPFWLAMAILCAAVPAMAQVRSSANYSITADGIDSGGGTSSSANYVQRSSLAQAFETPPMVGVSYGNQGGLLATTSPDLQAPATPSGLTATAVSTSQINLGWNAAIDNVAVTAYQVFRGGVFRTTVTAPTVTFSDTGLVPSTPYSYTVAACDAAGNCSAQSALALATTQAVPDTTPPSVPQNLTAAAAVSGSQIDLLWSASTDNVAVVAYLVYRGGVLRATVTGSTAFSDTGLAPSTLYSYTVAACDGSNNCSGQSNPASATTTSTYTANLVAGFNLIGNSLNLALDVPATFGNQDTPVTGITGNVLTVWKWVIIDGVGRWAFYSPQLSAAANATYAASRSYDVLATVNAGEGYWVNAITPMTLPVQSGDVFNWTSQTFANLPAGFNLIADASPRTPSEFNIAMNPTEPGAGEVPTGNFLTLWAWDAAAGTWYFYSPLLEASGGLQAVKDYAIGHSFLHFQDYSKTIGIGTGFWVNRP